jgi:hypothetical protein
MTNSTRTVLIALPAVALLAAFWFLVISPKREEASSLGDDITMLEAEVSELEQTIAAGEEARRGFPDDYQKVVVLGKAVPEDDDQATLFAQLSRISRRAKVDFRTLELVDEGDSAAVEATPAPAEPTTPPAGESATPEAQPAETPVAPAPATEAGAATLPIGATVGPAGLPVMPYSLGFEGDFFRLANFMKGLDRTVRASRHGEVSVDGRLMTVDGFSLTENPRVGFPFLLASVALTTYITPAEQGLTGGATPAGPAPATGSPAPASTDTTAPPTAGSATTGEVPSP